MRRLLVDCEAQRWDRGGRALVDELVVIHGRGTGGTCERDVVVWRARGPREVVERATATRARPQVVRSARIRQLERLEHVRNGSVIIFDVRVVTVRLDWDVAHAEIVVGVLVVGERDQPGVEERDGVHLIPRTD